MQQQQKEASLLLDGPPAAYTAAKALPPSSVTVTVLNGSGTNGAAAVATATLAQRGFRTQAPAGTDPAATTTIEYPAGMEAQAKSLAPDIPRAAVSLSTGVSPAPPDPQYRRCRLPQRRPRSTPRRTASTSRSLVLDRSGSVGSTQIHRPPRQAHGVSSLPVVGVGAVLAQVKVDWLGTAVVVAAAAWYLLMRRRVTASGGQWSQKRTALFLIGIAGYLWCIDGFLNAYRSTLLGVWAVQVLVLMLVIPIALMAGRPVELAALTARRRSLLSTVCDSRIARFVGHPFVGPAVVPLLCAVLFFCRCADLWSSRPWIATVLGLAVVGVGCLIARPLASDDPGEASLAVGVALMVSIVELLIDAIPGIVLRLETHLVTVHFAVSHAAWAMSPLADQRMAGSILWGVAEALDLPVLVLVFLRWGRVDERESQRVDRLIDEAEFDALISGEDAQLAVSQPWWVSDPQMSARLGTAVASPESDAAAFAALRTGRRRAPPR